MDEDDSQDELINHRRSHSQGKRAAVWDISDDSEDELEEESEEGESDSSDDDDDGEDHAHGDEEDEEEEEEEDDIKPEDGAPGGTSADFVEMSSDEDAEKCPICLNSFTSQPVATPENCEHYFCFDCILEWAKNSNSCPVDRITFNNVYLRKCYGGKLKKIITVQKPVKEGQEETVNLDLEQTNCEVCGGSDREDRLLLCDGCDAGYHMECLTPPLDSVPVEEWFCPECDANSRQSRNQDEELRDLHSLPSTARPATSHSHSRAVGPTRAIARTQQSERVRASVNRNRITQARSSQLAPTYLIQSTWLDETINAVVAGLNTAVYVRDFTPRAPSGRKRRTGKRRKVRSKKTSTTEGVKGKAAGTRVKRRKRRRRIKSQKKFGLKKVPTPRSRIANNLGIVKDKKSSSLPTVYRPTENTLSGMRADIGAASLSIYGDPFDLDPFVDREEAEQQVHVTSLLEAKRRGISHSALRSHQPVARPLTTSLARRHLDVSHAQSVVEAAPVPDLLGSILSGQSMLLMDSSDVVINRDGTLKAVKPGMNAFCRFGHISTVIPSTLEPGSRKSGSLGEEGIAISPGLSPNLPESSSVLSHNEDLRFSNASINRTFSQSSSRLSSCAPFSASHPRPTPNIDIPSRSPLTTYPNRPIASSIQQEIKEASLPIPDVGTRSKSISSSQVPNKKTALKPAWVDVSVLPRIPKLKKENSALTAESSSQEGNIGRNRVNHSRIGSTSSDGRGTRIGMPKTSITSLSGDKGKQQSIDQPKGQTGGHSQSDGPNRAKSSSSSSSFSNSFSSSSSSHASQPRHSTSSSTSAVSFRINSSGNSWQSRRLNVVPSVAGAGPQCERLKAKEEEVKNRQLHRDKQMLLASRAPANKEQDKYDPFNPTASDSSSSDSEYDCTNLDARSHRATEDKRSCNSKDKKAVVLNSQNVMQIKTETQEVEVSREESSKALKAKPSEGRGSRDDVKIKKELILDSAFEKQALVFDVKVKKEEPEEASNTSNVHVNTERANTSFFANHSFDQTTQHNITKVEKKEKGSPNKSVSKYGEDSPSSSSVTPKKKLKEETKSLSPKRSAVQNSETSNPSKKPYSSSSDTDGGRKGGHRPTSRGDKPREKDTDRSSNRSSSRERRRVRSSDSSQPNSPDRTRQKRQSRSSSKDKLRKSRSRSASSSSSRERMRRKKCRRSRERDDGKERRTKERRRDRHRSKSQSRSRSRSRSTSRSRNRKRGSSHSKSRSRSRERRRDPTKTALSNSKDHVQSRSKEKRRRRSRSNSRERRQEVGSSNVFQKTDSCSVSSSKDAKHSQGKRNEKGITPVVSNREEKLSKPHSSASRAGVKLEGDPETTKKAPIVEMTKGKTPCKDIKKEQPVVDICKAIKKEQPIVDICKNIKKEQPAVDMFEESPSILSLKKEPLHPKGATDQETSLPIKPESSHVNTSQCEPDTKEVLHSSVNASIAPLKVPDPLPVSVSAIKQQEDVEMTFQVKQEIKQNSDFDEDLNVDTALNSVENVKSEQTKGVAPAIKQEKEAEEEKNREKLLPASSGAKSKTQVKRVTWNIQEPEGPQPEKSASKVALYKKKLKQEGIRRPPSRDLPSTSVDLNKKSCVPLTAPPGSDGLQSEETTGAGQGEPAEGDLSRKDKYLKKLHMQERAVEEVKLAIKPYYQRRDINKEEYKEILRKAVQKVCHSKSGEINPVKVGNLVKAYVDKYKHARKQKKGEDSEKAPDVQCDAMIISDSP